MANKRSRNKNKVKDKTIERLLAEEKKPTRVQKAHEKKGLKVRFLELKSKVKEKRGERVRLHKSFRRSYREDYRRDIEVPGIMYHIFATFRIIFKNWKFRCIYTTDFNFIYLHIFQSSLKSFLI